MKYDLLHIQGKPYVLVPLHDYRAMTDEGADSDLPPEILDKLAARQESAIKIIRKHRSLTQKELADKAGISRPYLTEIEQGKKDGSVRAVKQVADALNIPISVLI